MAILSFEKETGRFLRALATVCLFALVLAVPSGVQAAPEDTAPTLESAIASTSAAELFPGGSSFGPVEGDQPATAILGPRGTPLGWAFLNTDYLTAVGFSGKPIHILISVDHDGILRGAKLIKHSEPIVIIGIRPSRVERLINSYTGRDVIGEMSRDYSLVPPVDPISGATVTVLVIDDAIKRSTVKFARSRNLAGLSPGAASSPRHELAQDVQAATPWHNLVQEGSVGQLMLSVGDINQAFRDTGNQEAAKRLAPGKPDDTYIDLRAAVVSLPAIGRTLLGERAYQELADSLGDSQHAILVMSEGNYSFRDPKFVRGGIFDRIRLIQGEESFLFREENYERIPRIRDRQAPRFGDIGLFRLPDNDRFDAAAPWRLQLLVQRSAGGQEKAFVTRAVSYDLPSRFVKSTPAAEPEPTPAIPENSLFGEPTSELWKTVWQMRKVDILVLSFAIGVLTVFFFGQNWFVARPNMLKTFRTGFLIFTLLWIGVYANAQISIVNVFAFSSALLTNFHWDYFLMDPMLFILWCSVAAAVILWGRGAFCGWLCPFGALQELLNKLAKLARIPQWAVPWPIHEILWPIKYMVFLGLFGLSFYSMVLAEMFAEVEPFKTVVVLKFARDWPYVIYAVTLLSIGLFVERFYCRYLCPLGAALALPGRLRINDWLKRYSQCGSPCMRCSNECPVQAVHPDGTIHVNECLYCLHCQELYKCDQRCPVVIQQRLRFEKRLAAQSAAMTPGHQEKSGD